MQAEGLQMLPSPSEALSPIRYKLLKRASFTLSVPRIFL